MDEKQAQHEAESLRKQGAPYPASEAMANRKYSEGLEKVAEGLRAIYDYLPDNPPDFVQPRKDAFMVMVSAALFLPDILNFEPIAEVIDAPSEGFYLNTVAELSETVKQYHKDTVEAIVEQAERKAGWDPNP